MSTPFHRAAVHLRRAASVTVGAHLRPDGDAIGSVLGLTLALRAAGIPAIPTLADETPLPPTYDFLPGFALFVPSAEIEQPEAFVALDTSSLGRLGLSESLARGATQLIVIDHHPDNEMFGTINIVDPSVSATTQLVWKLLEYLEVPRTSDIALCCYVGLISDTGRFSHQNTTPLALRDAAAMIEAGVEPSEVARLLYQEHTHASITLEARVLARLTVVNGGRVVYSWCDDADFTETGASANDTENLPDAIRRLGGVDVAVLMRVAEDEIRVNLRAKTSFDVSAVARSFGGGGHTAAAGFTFTASVGDLLPLLLARLPSAETNTP